LLPALILIAYLLAIPAGAEIDVNDADQIIYMIFRRAIFDSLAANLSGNTNSLDKWQVATIAGKALEAEAAGLRKNNSWITDNRLEGKVTKIADIVEDRIKNAHSPLTVKTGVDKDETTNAYLVSLLGETSPISRAQAYSNHPLSGYKFILGGSWTHADSGAAEGIFSASMLFRTRFYDSRGKLDNSMLKNPETENWYVDLAVDAHFVTNTPFNKVINDTTINGRLIADEVLLESVTSSKLSMGLVSGTPLKFVDYGTVGPYVRFEISTQEGSGDIFRRMIVGLRFENRSVYSIREAAAEVGLTINTAAGSLQSNKIFELDELKRVVLNFELPIRGQSNRGLYIKFHGEWPIGSKDEIVNIASGESEEISPPIYQFQFGALFDPLDIFGPLFGLGK
jgi:hypothetical protein